MRRVFLIAILMFANALHAGETSLRADLERLAHERIYFGHQSVGANILDGLKELSAEAGVPLRVVETARAASLGAAGVGHVFVAQNGDPLRKLDSFKAALGHGSHADIALLKFCYVDISADTDARELFKHYRETIEKLRASNPST